MPPFPSFPDRADSSERTLGRISESLNPLSQVNTFGVVIDKVECQSANNENIRFSRLKIIAPSFNFSSKIDNPKLKKQIYAILFVHQDHKGNMPVIDRVGDIIRVRRFDFKINKTGELIGEHQVHSNWMTFNCTSIQQIEPLSQKAFRSKTSISLPTPYEIKEIKKLAAWVYNFFSKHTLRNITWWNSLREMPDQMTGLGQTFEGVDLILYASGIDDSGNTVLNDEHKNDYIFESPIEHIVSSYIKLVNINVLITKKFRVLKTTPKSSCLLLLNDSADVSLFNEEVSRENPRLAFRCNPFRRHKTSLEIAETPKDVLDKFPGLSRFPFEKHLLGKRGLFGAEEGLNPKCKKLTILEKPFLGRPPYNFQQLKTELTQLHSNEHSIPRIIKAFICPKNELKVKIMKKCSSCKKIFLSQRVTKKCCQSSNVSITLVLNFKLIEDPYNCKEWISVYLVCNEPLDHPLQLWAWLPSLSNEEQWDEERTEIKEKLIRRFSIMSNLSIELSFLIEPTFTEKGNLYCLIKNTIFLP